MRRPFLDLRYRLTSVLAIAAVAAASLPAPAFAQDSENVAAARSLGIQGVKLAEEGKCKEAIEKLERAEALYHAPTILGRLGECQVQVGQIVRGTENLNKVVREQLAANAPKAFVDAQERARKVLDAALPRIAYLTVNIEPAGTQAEVTVGTTPVPHALIGAERPTDPGTHEVSASAQGFLPAKASVRLAEGAHEQVTLKLVADPNAAVAPAPAPTPAAPPPSSTPLLPPANASTTSSGGGGKTAGYILLGVGGAGLVVGSITGFMAMSDASDLKDKCDDGESGNCEQDDIDSAKSVALVSTIGFGVGVGAGLLGVILLATSGRSETAEREGVRPYVGVGNAGLTGRF
jgi:hypothetical protein